MTNKFKKIIEKTFSAIPSTLKARSEFPRLVDAIKTAIEFTRENSCAVTEIYFDNLNVATLEMCNNDEIDCCYNLANIATETFDAFDLSTAQYIAADLTADFQVTINEYLDSVKTFDVTISTFYNPTSYKII